MDYEISRIEKEYEVASYIQNLIFALDHGSIITFQIERKVDSSRDIKYTNKYTISDLFPNESPVQAVKHELRKLKTSEYIKTVKDTRFTDRSEMRVFGREYDGKGDVYIKIRVELLGYAGNHKTFVMSFHYAERPFLAENFPYKS